MKTYEELRNHRYTLRTRLAHWAVLQLDRLAYLISHEGPVNQAIWALIPERDRL